MPTVGVAMGVRCCLLKVQQRIKFSSKANMDRRRDIHTFACAFHLSGNIYYVYAMQPSIYTCTLTWACTNECIAVWPAYWPAARSARNSSSSIARAAAAVATTGSNVCCSFLNATNEENCSVRCGQYSWANAFNAWASKKQPNAYEPNPVGQHKQQKAICC